MTTARCSTPRSGSDGGTKRGTARCWPQTEALKAALQRPRPDSAPRAARPNRPAHLRPAHLAGPIAGAWHDRLDAERKPVRGDVPATSFYHLFNVSRIP